MTARRSLLVVLLLVLGLTPSPATAQDAGAEPAAENPTTAVASPGRFIDPYPTAGAADHGWFVKPSRDGTRATVYHVPGDATPGSVRIGPTITQLPAAVAAHADSLILVHGPIATLSRGPVRPVRELTTVRVRPGWYIYQEPVPLPPLPGGGRLVSLARAPGALAALMEGPIGVIPGDAEASEASPAHAPSRLNLGLAWHMLLLRDGRWTRAELPPLRDLDAQLLALGSALAIVCREAGGASTLWTTEINAGQPLDWKSRRIGLAHDAWVGVVGGQIVALRRVPGSGLDFAVVRAESPVSRATIEGIPSSAAVVPAGERLTFVWELPDQPVRFMTRCITLGGVMIHEGPAPLSSPVGVTEFQLLALVLASLVLSVMLFLFRPERVASRPVVLPQGASLADPWRRLLACGIDATPGLLLVTSLWNQPPGLVMGGPGAEASIWPLLIVAAITAAHTAITEVVWGRTIGKMVLGLRTVTIKGEKPTPLQAIGRSIIKVACPPLVVFVLLFPYVPHPGSLGTVVIVDPGVLPDDRPPEDGPGGRSGGSSGGGSGGGV